ncbi:hypothetical protein [Pseudarthrobacter sp. BIM B-2242]|nr:hypothetical protein [Pseudarthrobacter sp. BIM B-2242]
MDPTRYAIGLLVMAISLLAMTLVSLFALSSTRRKSNAGPESEE